MKAVDLFCGAGGVSVGLERAGFEVVAAVDIRPIKCHRGGRFVQADALEFEIPEGVDFVWASPPCQAHSRLRHLHPERTYPDLIAATRAKLWSWELTRRQGYEGGLPPRPRLWCVENVPGAPLQPAAGNRLLMLCGTMFGLESPDGWAELQRHRWFECNWPIPLRPQCQHSGRRAISITGNSAQTNVVRNETRRVFLADEARATMGIDWMPMKYLSQAIPPAYAEWVGRQAIEHLGCG